MKVGGVGWVMGKVLLRINAATSPAAFGLDIQTLLMANPDVLFGVRRTGEVVEVFEIDSPDR